MANPKVLLLEVQRANSPTFAAALEKRGYNVVVERVPQTALKRSASLSPDLVVLNAASLKTSGARICRQIRSSLNHTPVVIVADKKNVPDANCGAAASQSAVGTSPANALPNLKHPLSSESIR